ncbi:MAG: IS21 family transposase [Eggerthellaceae bacterium]|nr:IS21 family transposase [Eggerthellaceae bacterium]
MGTLPKLVLKLRAAGHSRNSIAKSQGMAKASVIAVFDAADELGIAYGDVADKDDAEVYALLFPGKFSKESVFDEPDWGYVHRELGKVGVTLDLLHEEYAEGCAKNGGVAMSYTTFWRRYGEYVSRNAVTSHIDRKAGRSVEVDWSGPTMSLVVPATGEVVKVYLFVASLPYSRYDYVEPTLDMKQDTWLLCHVHMFSFFGASVPRIVPDNCKTAIVSHPREGEVVLNDAYREMAAHYGAAVLPARVGMPKDKPSAEGTVGNVATDIIARLRNETFTSMAQLKSAVAERLAEHNAEPFQKREGSRESVFLEEELPAMQPLPAAPYEISRWVYGRKVAANSHVSYGRNHYSCDWQRIGQRVDLRITQTTLEIYAKSGERLATHPLFPPYVSNGYSTRESDLPEGKVWREWDGDRIRKWAGRVGPACEGCVNRIFESVRFEEQGFDAALAILRMTRAYSAQRVEAACDIALGKVKSPRYRHVKAVLDANADKASAPEAAEERGGYVRGADYYSGEARA